MRSSLLLVAGTAALATARPARAQRYVAATNETVASSTVQSEGDAAVHAIYIDNRSTVPITVFSVAISQCENVRQQCAPRRTNIRVRPGGRELAVRVEPRNRELGFTYAFNFGWHADSGSVAAVAAMAAAGSSRAQTQLDGYRRADSLQRADRARGIRTPELTRDDFTALAGRAVRLRAAPDSLLIAPGDRADLDQLVLYVVDSAGTVLGRTRWLSWQTPASGAVQFTPPTRLQGRDLGRAVLRFRLADDAQALLGRDVDAVEVPVRVGYPADAHAPAFAGVATDVDRAGAPLACAEVALEDTAAAVTVARGRTDARGAYRLPAPRPGAYRVRVDAYGWAPVYGPVETAGRDTTVTREVPVRFTEQLLTNPRFAPPSDDGEALEHASVASFSTAPVSAARGAAAAPVSRVALGGSPTAPVLGIVTRGPSTTTWMQFVVDPTGRADLATLSLAGGTTAAQAAGLRAVLPRLRFSPARVGGRPACELVRMQARFGAP